MRENLFRWATVIGAIPRIVQFESRMQHLGYYDRLRLLSTIFGPDWIFRLHDLVGAETIQSTRPSWLAFYRDDNYKLHMPLDPRAPETDEYLGPDLGAKEFAFYCGMGFEGYALALRTRREIDTSTLSMRFDEYNLAGIDLSLLAELRSRELTASDYYRHYGEALTSLFALYHRIANRTHSLSDDDLEQAAAASLMFLCGGHQGCSAHIDHDEGQQVRLQTIVLCRYVRAIAQGELGLLAVPRRQAA